MKISKPVLLADSESLKKLDKQERIKMLDSQRTFGKHAAKVEKEVHEINWADFITSRELQLYSSRFLWTFESPITETQRGSSVGLAILSKDKNYRVTLAPIM